MRILLAIAALSVPALAQAGSITRLDGTRISFEQIDATATRAMRDAHVTGLGIAVFEHGKVAYLKTYGGPTPDSVMTAASLTKPAFAMLVMQLVEQGVLDLDRPIA